MFSPTIRDVVSVVVVMWKLTLGARCWNCSVTTLFPLYKSLTLMTSLQVFPRSLPVFSLYLAIDHSLFSVFPFKLSLNKFQLFQKPSIGFVSFLLITDYWSPWLHWCKSSEEVRMKVSWDSSRWKHNMWPGDWDFWEGDSKIDKRNRKEQGLWLQCGTKSSSLVLRCCCWEVCLNASGPWFKLFSFWL